MDATDRANPTISAICTKLDGLPLAIELAAAQSYDQRLSALARCLEDDFPTATRRTLDRRQQSIPALLDWSVDRLTPEAQAAFRAVGAISGSFTAQTADVVCGASAPLTTLVAKSLVVKDKDRYVLLETTRRHARNLLDAAGDGDAVRTRLLAHARAIAGEAQALLPLLQRPAWRELFEPEVELVRGALHWAFTTPAAELDGIALAAELDTLWWETSRAVEGVRWIERALARLPNDAPKALHARCRLAAAWLRPEGSARIDVAERAFAARADLASDSERARAGCAYAWSAQYLENRRHVMDGVLRDARAHAECANDAYATALAVHLQGDVALRAHRDTEASALYDDALARYRSAADDRGVAMVLANIAEGAFRRGELGDALRFSAESLAIMRSRNERQIALPLIVNIAMYAVAKGDAERARIHADEGFAIASDAGLAMETAMFLPVYASLAAHQRDFARAARLVGCTDRLYREGNFLRDHTELVIYETLVERLRAEMSDDDFAREHAIGARSTPAEAVRAPRAGTRGRSSATA
jgi:non-specific serine/threonine protein kinase